MSLQRLADLLVQDLRYGFRTLVKARGFTVVAVLSLGTGIGANTALFSVADALLLRPLRVHAPEQLVTLEQMLPSGARQYNFSYMDARAFDASADRVFSGVAAISWADGYDAAAGPAAIGSTRERVQVSLVTGDYFSVIGAGARIGRLMTPADDAVAGAHPVAVISDGYWKQRFGRDPAVIGRRLLLNGTSYSIVGVAAAGFSGDWVGWPTDVWVPTAMAAQMMPSQPSSESENLRLRLQYKVIARLAPGVSIPRARAAADAVYRDLQQHPRPLSGVNDKARLDVVSAAAGYSPQRPAFLQPIRILMVMVGVLMLIVCANVANLLLARSAARERELAVRLAMGATRARLVSQLLTENLVLGVLGAAAGLLLAYWGTDALLAIVRSGPVTTVTAGAPSVELQVSPDARVIGFTALLALAATALFGLAPAWRGSRTSIRAGMGRQAMTSDLRRPGPRKLLLIAQVAASMTLLICTGLFLRTIGTLKAQPLGFDRDHVLLVWALPGPTGHQGAPLVSMWESIEQRVAAMPGVIAASASVEGLLGGAATGGPLVTVDAPGADPLRVEATMTIGPRFFETVGQPLLDGREFRPGDTASAAPVVIVNDAFARRAFGVNRRAVGQRLLIARSRVEIIGVVKDARQHVPGTAPALTLYYPQAQNLRRLSRAMCLVVRTAGPPETLAGAIRQELARAEPGMPVLKIDTVGEQLDAVLFQERLIARLSLFFAVVALFLTCIGLYGVMSFITARRTHAVGIRLALGATPGSVMREVFQESGAVIGAGIALGVPIAVASARLVSSRLFGVGPADPATIAAVAALMLTVTAAAVFLPARRAAMLNPLDALHAE